MALSKTSSFTLRLVSALLLSAAMTVSGFQHPGYGRLSRLSARPIHSQIFPSRQLLLAQHQDDDKDPTADPSVTRVNDQGTSRPLFAGGSPRQLLTDLRKRRLPPFRVEDFDVLLYDVFLLVNLVVSISFWVVHRMNLDYIAESLSEGCLLSLLWICAGLLNGSFLLSAVDGHKENGGAREAGLLAFNTFVNAATLRVLLALIVAFGEHRPVGSMAGEEFLTLEISFGVVLMSFWRALHSTYAKQL